MVVAANHASGFPPSTFVRVELAEDYSRNDEVELSITYRTNVDQTKAGTLFWDGVPVLNCNPNRESEALAEAGIRLSTAQHDFAPGLHVIDLQARDFTENAKDFFQVDAVRVRRVGSPRQPAAPVASSWILVTGEQVSGPEMLNLLRLRGELSRLAGQGIPARPRGSTHPTAASAVAPDPRR
jgi:hypothetical protein